MDLSINSLNGIPSPNSNIPNTPNSINPSQLAAAAAAVAAQAQNQQQQLSRLKSPLNPQFHHLPPGVQQVSSSLNNFQPHLQHPYYMPQNGSHPTQVLNNQNSNRSNSPYTQNPNLDPGPNSNGRYIIHVKTN